MQEDLGEDEFLLLVVCGLKIEHTNVDGWFLEIKIQTYQ